MKQYEHFSEEDFVNDPAFQDWVLLPNEENDRYWNGFLQQFPDKRPVINQAAKQLTRFAFRENWPSEEKVAASLQVALQSINQRSSGATITSFRKMYKWLSVAAVLLVVIGGAYWLISKNENIIPSDNQFAVKKDPLAPGGDKAVLTLAEGKRIFLDSTAKGTLANQGGVSVINTAASISYEVNDNVKNETLYNTINTPRGGQYQVVLGDGTKVWLNSSSSLKYPVAFTGTERFVELTGEAYFEVARNEKQPFLVKVNNMEIEVLGTHFNINGYADEQQVRTTLLEGRVKVKAGQKLLYLDPGQQALADANNEYLRVRNEVDINQVVAWKNGDFDFGKATEIHAVMRQLARWYDLEVAYEGKVEGTIGGALPRNANAAKVLKMLAATGSVKFKITGNKVTVIPGNNN